MSGASLGAGRDERAGTAGTDAVALVRADATRVLQALGSLAGAFAGTRVLVTGHRGFLGANFCAVLDELVRMGAGPQEIVCVDAGRVPLEDVSLPFTAGFQVIEGDAVRDLPHTDFDWILHCAGIASPSFYRRQPLATIDVNAVSYWSLLERLDPDRLRGLLYFSTSEVYGDPPADQVPTHESYRGNVSCTGPRACYDESKRLGETMSVAFARERGLPVKIARPFNVYGPLMRREDRRVLPDFVGQALATGRIELLSDGRPTRSFTYVSDAIEGFLRVLLLGRAGRPYNVGATQELSMLQLAHEVSKEVGGCQVDFEHSPDEEYHADNPMRRCPDVSRAREELGFVARVGLQEGLSRTVAWYRAHYGREQR